MKDRNAITPALSYFFKRLEKRSDEIQRLLDEDAELHKELPFEDVHFFFRQIMTQNIFINTVGQNGKRESTILSKAIFCIDQVVRVYYSTSFDEDNTGFIRIRPDFTQQLIVVERMHGNRAKPEFIYGSRDQCHIIRFMIRWVLRRIDWDKTTLKNLELYKRYLDELEAEEKAKVLAELALEEQESMKKALLNKAKRVTTKES